MASFDSARGSATTPAFTGLPASVGPQQMMCSIVESVFNTIYAPNTSIVNATANFFQQANRNDCNIAATASAYATKDPQGMIAVLSKLYWQGTISDDLPAPRDYALALDAHPAICAENGGWCQGPAMFVYSVGMRDAMNVHTLSQDRAENSTASMGVLEAHSHIAAAPTAGSGTQGGTGASYFAVSGQMAAWTEWLVGHRPSIVQGACTTAECASLLDGLLPEEIVSLKRWFDEALPAAMRGGSPPPYAGWSANVQRKIDAGLMADVNDYFRPVSSADLTGVCRRSAGSPVYLGISESVLPGQGEAAPAGSCVEGSPLPCVLDHWVVLQTSNSCDETCTVWSWGSLYSLPCAQLAAGTTTIMHNI